MRILRGPQAYDPQRRLCVELASWFLVILGFITILIMLLPSWANWQNQLLAKVVLLFAAGLPPLWFWAEYCLLWSNAPETKRPAFEYFKYGQDVSRNLWLAFVGIILALYFQ